MTLILKAKKIANEWHSRSHQLHGGLPYIVHLVKVAEVLRRFGHTNPEMLAAAYLHDILEDTKYPRETLAWEFGQTVCILVEAVTNKPANSRDESLKATYPLLSQNEQAIILKLADRIGNVETGLENHDIKYIQRYRKEHAEFSRWLRKPGNPAITVMFEYLDGLLFDNNNQQSYHVGHLPTIRV